MKGQAWIGLAIFILFLALLVGILAINLVSKWLGFGVETISPDFVYDNYVWFKEQYTAIQQVSVMIQNAKGEVQDFKELYGDTSTWSWEINDEYSRLLTVKNGYISKYNQLVAQYNAKASNARVNWVEGEYPAQVVRYIE